MSANSDSPIDSEHGRVQPMPALALIGGLAASVLGAILWAAVTVTAKFQIGFMAVGMGVLVGFTVRYLGQGGTAAFGVLGAAVSLFGCLLGNLFSEGLESIWSAGEEFYLRHLRQDYPEMCRKCDEYYTYNF